MKNRNLKHSDNWETPKYLYDDLNKEFDFDFDPCPIDLDAMIHPDKNGLLIDWGKRNYINPPYSRYLKAEFIKRSIEEYKQGKLCVLLIPVSTSTKLFKDHIEPNYTEIRFIRGRVPFVGINGKGEYVNWHLTERKAPEGAKHIKENGMHDSMIIVLDGRKKEV